MNKLFDKIIHAAENGIDLTKTPSTEEESKKVAEYFGLPTEAPKTPNDLRHYCQCLGVEVAETKPVDGLPVWIADLTSDPWFIGVLQGIPVIVCGTMMAEDPNVIGFEWHEAGHFHEPGAMPSHELIGNPLAAIMAHWGPMAMRHEVLADWYACKHGHGWELLNGLKAAKIRFQNIFDVKYTGDTNDRITRITDWLEDGIWRDDGITRLPTVEEIKTGIREAGDDVANVLLIAGMAQFIRKEDYKKVSDIPDWAKAIIKA